MEFHIRCEAKDIARYVFVPGDHDRARKIAAHLDSPKLVSDSRGYLVFTGAIDGIRMTVSSTGMGGPCAAICFEELGHLGADTFIRVGSCGTYQDNVTCGDVLISTGTYRGAGTANNYLPVAFPAVPNFQVTMVLVKAAQKLGAEVHVGLGSSGDAFYGPKDLALQAVLKEAGLIFREMESDTLFILAAVRGWRAAALFACDGTATEVKPAWGEAVFRQGEETAIRIAIEAMKSIALTDSRDESSRA